jgi:hypothetical protein
MLRHKRRKFQVLPIVDAHNDDHIYEAPPIANDTTSLPQATKRLPASSLAQMVEQRTWENEQLRKELIYQRRKHGISMYLLDEVRLIVESLQKALENFQKCNTEIEIEFVDPASSN